MSELRATLSRSQKRRGIREVFSLENIIPKSSRALKAKFPPPLNHKAVVHHRSIDNPQSALVFGEAHEFPLNKTILPAVVSRIPEKATTILVKTIMNKTREPIKPHGISGQGRKSRINKTDFGSRGMVSTPPS